VNIVIIEWHAELRSRLCYWRFMLVNILDAASLLEASWWSLGWACELFCDRSSQAVWPNSHFVL